MSNKTDQKKTKELAEHFFRNEYGRIVSVITRYLGTNNVETAEDIVQETLLKAVNHWQHNGTPKNPQAWLYVTAKNITLNIIKRKKYHSQYAAQIENIESDFLETKEILISEQFIVDDQLKMMFCCCHPSISEDQQIALILKVMCGFSISEISSAFFSSAETINKRLVRARKSLRENNVSFEIPQNLNKHMPIVLKTIYLLFNEGYKSSNGNELIKYDLCLEAIRLLKLLEENNNIKSKSECYALLALMYLNASRFKARKNTDGSILEMHEQDRSKWDQDLISNGIYYFNKSGQQESVSIYHLMAAISANHCIAQRFEETNWIEILSLYDNLILLDNSPIIHLNRSVALSKIKGNIAAISELKKLELNSDIGDYYLFHSTLAELLNQEMEKDEAAEHFKKAINLVKNKLESEILEKKLHTIVPIC